MKEEEVAAMIVHYLREHEWDVHQEVSMGYSSARADIVAVRGPVVMVVETKVGVSMALMAQTEGWIGKANYVVMGIGTVMKYNTERFVTRWARNNGVGLWVVYSGRMNQSVDPKLHRKATTDRLRERLNDGTREYARAGNADCRFWSPFRETCQGVERYVKAHPGSSTTEVMRGLEKHHYANDASARGSLLKWAQLDKIPGVELRPNGRSYAWFPVAAQGAG